MARFRHLFQNRNFVFLWLGQIISQFGDRLNQIVLIALVYHKAPGSAYQLAKLLSFTIIPAFLISPIAGAYVDRWNRKHTMIFSDLARGILVLAIPALLIAAKTLWPIYGIVFLIFAVSCFFLPARLAIIPDVVERKDLLIANSVFTTTGMVAGVLAFALGGLLIEAVKELTGFFINAGIYWLSALVISLISVSAVFKKRQEGSFGQVLKTSLIGEIREGVSYLINHKDVRFIIRSLFILMAGAGAIYAVLVVFIQETLGSVTRDLGIFSFLFGLGFLIGSVGYGRFGQKIAKQKIISFSLIIVGGLISAFALVLKFYHSFIGAGSIIVLIGASVAPIAVSASTLVHELSHEEMRGRVFSSIGIVMNFSLLLFMLLASRLADFVDRVWILGVTSLAFIIFGLIEGEKKWTMSSLSSAPGPPD